LRSAHGRDLAIYFAHAHGAGRFALRILARAFVRRWRRRNAPDVVFDAHDDNHRFTAPINQKALVSLLCSFEDLFLLSAGGDGGNDVAHGWFRLFNDKLLELINQFI